MGHTMGFLPSSIAKQGFIKSTVIVEGSVLAMKPFPWIWASRVAPAEAFRERDGKRTGKATCSWCGRFSGFTEDHRKLPWHLCCICAVHARGQGLHSSSWPAFLVKEGPRKMRSQTLLACLLFCQCPSVNIFSDSGDQKHEVTIKAMTVW